MPGNKNSGRKPSEIKTKYVRITMTQEQFKFITNMSKRNEWTLAKAARKLFEMGYEKAIK